MGVTILTGLLIWAAGSYVEYRIISAWPRLEAMFRGVPGIVISLTIGGLLAYALAIGGQPAGGAGVMLGQMLGLATNQFTFKFYSTVARLNRKRHAALSHVNGFKTAHPTLVHEAVATIKGGFKTIGFLVLAIVYLIGVPFRLYQHGRNLVSRIFFRKKLVRA